MMNERDKHIAHESEPPRLRVRVLFFGAARETVGADEETLDVSAPATAASVFDEILERHIELRRFGRALLVAVNEEYAPIDREVNEGDEVAVFPPVSGGDETEEGFFELTTSPINVGEVARRIVPHHCGATVTLDGYVREWTHGRKTLYLIYEAYPPMALREMKRLGREAHAKFEIAHIGIVHRTGRLEIGETSVVISVSAPHRRAAFEACEWAIHELKRTVPIWKKEFFADGEAWVEGEGAPPLASHGD
jgi:molybdopterin synthase catalytic subunit